MVHPGHGADVALHVVAREDDRIDPGERGDADQAGQHDQPVAAHEGFYGSGSTGGQGLLRCLERMWPAGI